MPTQDIGDYTVTTTITPNGKTETWVARPGTPSALAQARNDRIRAALPVLRQWASDARATTVTSGNAVATLQVVVNRLGTFFDNFADLLEEMGSN